MKFPHSLLVASWALLATACEKKSAPQPAPPLSEAAVDLKQADTPILPLEKGDVWKYKVRVQIPEGVTSEGASEVDVEHERTRTYLAKVSLGQNYPEVDAFEVRMRGTPVEWELVEIHDDRVMMRGTAHPEKQGARPVWFQTPIPFVVAGMRPGQETVNMEVQDGARRRGIKVVAREQVKVPAGEFSAIRLLMTGTDGGFEIRRTTWFAPGVGIVKEEKVRYAKDKLLFRETAELVETTAGPD